MLTTDRVNRAEYLRGLRERYRKKGMCSNCGSRLARKKRDTCEYCASWQKRKRAADAAAARRPAPRRIECTRCTDPPAPGSEFCPRHLVWLADPDVARIELEARTGGGDD
jgi:hypothetical protein